MYRRSRGQKRKWCSDIGSFEDGQTRRSPRLPGLGSVFDSIPKSSHPPLIDVGAGANTNASAAITSSSTKETSSKELLLFGFGLVQPKHHHHMLPPCNTDKNQDDNDKHSCPTPYSTKNQINFSLSPPCSVHSSKRHDGAPKLLNNDESWLPDKSILELVLDTLQRRDTYDIFAEPVDPSEVEEYYEIIKEPMDFGTMRAKLHEGMYRNLQQFKRDIFLIFGNAIYFNSSSTVYFRQARALEELAKKVFNSLETDPENFRVKFTASRRRSSRRFDGEVSGSTSGSCRKLTSDSGSDNMHIDLDRKGCRRQIRTCLSRVDRRSTYKPWMCLFNEASSIVSPIHYGTQLLTHANEEKIGYKNSLTMFVKDLGATAHKVAKHKLQGLQTEGSSRRPHMNCWDNPNVFQRETNHSLICGTTPLDIETGHKKRKLSDVSNNGAKTKATTSSFSPSRFILDRSINNISARQGSNEIGEGKFDLNQVQFEAISNSSHNIYKDENLKTHEMAPSSGFRNELRRLHFIPSLSHRIQPTRLHFIPNQPHTNL